MNISLSLSALSPPVIPSGNDSSFTYLQEQIGKKDFREAIQQLLFLLLDISASPKIYDCLHLLIPHFTGEDMRKLDGRLFTFLQRFPIDQVQKRKLALALADWHICHAPKDNFLIQLSSYQNAMRCFAQALKIQEQDRDRIHCEASALFVRLIESIWLHKNTFQEEIAKAKSKGDIEEIERLIDQIEKLNIFCQTEQDQEVIKTLYRQARDVINQDYKETFSPCLGKIARGVSTPFALAELSVTKKHHQALQKFRSSFASLPSSPLQLRQFQAEITAHFKDFVHLLFEDIFALLGPSPGEYAFLAMGSAAREELCSFSDLEPLILCQNDAVKEYFTQAIALLQLMILSLGETPSTHIHQLPRGLFLDGALTEAIRMPDTLASLLLSDLNADDPCTSLAHTACKTLTLCSNTTTLLEIYQSRLQEVLATPSNDNLALRHHLANALFKRRLKDYCAQWSQPPFIDKRVNLKTQYVELLYHLLADIGFYFSILKNNTLDLLDAFEEHKVFTPESCQLLKEAVTQIYLLRLRLHCYYQEQKEEAYTEGMTGYILSTQERTMLAKIYWLALRPLYRSLQEILAEEKPLEKIFHELDLFDKVFNEMMTSDNPTSCQPLFFHLTTHLLNSNTPFGRHLIYFGKLSQHTHHEPLREAYFNAIKDHLPLEKIEHLLLIPNKSGVRLFAKNNAYKLHTDIQALIDPEPHQKQNLPQVKVSIAGQTPAYLKPAIIEKLIDSEGNVRQTYPDSAHKVCALGPLHIKQKPTQPLMEYAMYSLFLRIGGHLSPTHQLVRFDVVIEGNQKSYPVLISETIAGKTLKEEQEFTLSSQNWAKWTWMLFCAIFTRPGDGRRSNYILDAQQQIFCIDNDISFIEPVVQHRFTKTIHFCCALFCLFPERPLDPNVLQAFCALDADAILHSWIEDIIDKEKEYHALFSEEEKQRLYHEDPNNRFKTTLLFREGALATLNLQFISLQNAFIFALQHKKALYPLDLLKEVVNLRESPILEKASGRYLFQAYQKSLSFPIQERLEQATSRSQDKSLSSLQSDPATLGKVPTWEEIEKRNLWTPTKAKEELFMTLLNRSAKYLSLGKVQGRRTLRANFRHLQHENTPDLERQILVLQALIYLMNRESDRPTAITLQHCATLDARTLTSFLHENLEYLDLSFCPKIKDRDIEQIQKKCPFLQTLILRGCSQLVNIASSGLFATQPLDFARQELKILKGHTGEICTLIALKGEKVLASGSDDCTIRLWDVASGQPLRILQGHTDGIYTLVALEGGKTLASGSIDNTTRLWDVTSGQERKILKRLEDDILDVDILIALERGKTLTSVGGNTILLWDVTSGQKRKLKGHTLLIETLIALEGGKTLVSGSRDETIRLWDVASGQQRKILVGHTGRVNILIALEGEKTLASGSSDCTIRLWDIASGQELKILQGYTDWVQTLIALEGGKTLASGNSDHSIRLWDVASGQERKILRGHTDLVRSLIALEGGNILASGSDDHTIRLWDIASGQEFKILQRHIDQNETLISLEGGKILASGSDDYTIRLWNFRPWLEHLDIGYCENLRSVRIKASLKTFKANNSRQLENVEIETDCMPRLEIKQCEKLKLKHILHVMWNCVLQSERDDLFPVLLSSSIVNILAEFVKEAPSCQERLLEVMELYKTDSSLATSAANAMGILNQAGISFAGESSV